MTSTTSTEVAPAELPAWARRLLDGHPGAPLPTPAEPMPKWLEEELRRAPLWLHIRGSAQDPRSKAPYHLVEDVFTEPALLRETLSLAGRMDRLVAEFVGEGIERVVFTGAGSAWYASVLAAFTLPRLAAGVSCEAVEAWEFYNYAQPSPTKSLLVAQSATGGSFEVVEAAKRAKELGMATLALTNTVGSPLERQAATTVVMPAAQKTGPDISVIPVRLLMTYLFALAWARRRPALGANLASLEGQLERIPDVAEQFIRASDSLGGLASRISRQQALLIVGGGPNWFSALEAGLKIEEESSTPCRAYTPGDFHHMAISLLGPSRTVLVFAVPGPSYERSVTCLSTARAAGSPTVAVVNEGDTTAVREADDSIVVPGGLDELLFPPLATITGQLLGYHLGLAKGVNPDCLGTDDLGHALAWLVSFPFGTH